VVFAPLLPARLLLIEMPWAESTAIIEQLLEDNDMLDARTISTDELRQRLDHGHIAHLWNVLTSQYFTGEMIPGSTRLPLDTIDHATTSVPKDAEIITYCGGPKCPQSAQAAQRLRELGYTNVRAYEEGLEGWKAAGHTVETLQEPAPAA
jgi:rhodanese-related sulfurtransferase